jgi:hypothetical protein
MKLQVGGASIMQRSLLGHGSTFDRPNSLPAQGEVQESQSPETSQAPSLRDLVSNPRRKDLGL